MKIAYIIPRFYPFKGGAEQNFFALASRMAKKGHEVSVITTNVKFRDEPLARVEIFEGIKIIRNRAWNNSLYAGFYPGLLTTLILNKFDVIHASGIGFLWREFCLIIKKIVSRNKTKFVVTPHGPFMALGDKSGFRGFARKTYTFILSLFLNSLYNKFIAVNPSQHKWMSADYNISPEKIEVVPNGIDETYLEKELFEHKEEDRVVITYMNRHEWYKGIQNVVEALNELRSSAVTNFVFYIMGRVGNYTQNLKDLIEKLEMQDFCKFIFSPHDEERDRIFYTESQINILPSKWEATGITLIEAMAKGNALITTFQNEAWELVIKEGKSGFVYEFGDVKALKNILKKLITEFELRQKIRRNNIDFAANFTWEAVFPKYEEMIKNL